MTRGEWVSRDDREAIRKVFRDRVKERLGLTDQQAKWLELRKGRGHRWMGRGRAMAM